MRKADKRAQLALFGVPRWVATNIVTKAVPCSLSKTGWHYVTIGMTHNEKKEALAQRRALVTFVRDECEDRPANEVEAVVRLGGTCCRQASKAAYIAYQKSEGNGIPESSEPVFGLGYAYRSSRRAERSHRTTPYRYMPELPEVRWARLLTQKARRAAGEGFNGISVEWAPKFPNDPWWVNGTPLEAAEMLLRFGNRRVAIRVSGVWKFSDTVILEALEDTPSGHSHCWKYGGREKEDVCLVCAKAVKFTEPHTRKSRHGKAVLEGLRRAMFALRKPKRPIVLDI